MASRTFSPGTLCLWALVELDLLRQSCTQAKEAWMSYIDELDRIDLLPAPSGHESWVLDELSISSPLEDTVLGSAQFDWFWLERIGLIA
jgi:hypothetical protein